MIGSFISAISPSTNVALTILGPILSPLILFSGFYLNFEYAIISFHPTILFSLFIVVALNKKKTVLYQYTSDGCAT